MAKTSTSILFILPLAVLICATPMAAQTSESKANAERHFGLNVLPILRSKCFALWSSSAPALGLGATTSRALGFDKPITTHGFDPVRKARRHNLSTPSTLKPDVEPDSPGTLMIDGEFEQQTEGTLGIGFDQTILEAIQNDQLIITGVATLDGQLNIELMDHDEFPVPGVLGRGRVKFSPRGDGLKSKLSEADHHLLDVLPLFSLVCVAIQVKCQATRFPRNFTLQRSRSRVRIDVGK